MLWKGNKSEISLTLALVETDPPLPRLMVCVFSVVLKNTVEGTMESHSSGM